MKTGESHKTSTQLARRYCSILSLWRDPMARDSAEVKPVDSPTQSAIMKYSKGTVRPMEATAASPIVAA